MAILKHIASKNANYGSAIDYLKYQHDEFHLVPVLDERGNMLLREEFYLDGLNCHPETFDLECELLNQQYHKNNPYDEIKSHHYIISHDPRDNADHDLTGERAQAIGLEYAKANFPGHQALVCTHTDGNNGTGNIHTHIIINSLRKFDVDPQPFTERPIDCRAGYKHHLTKDYLKHLQKSLMDICQREGLHQVDLLSPAADKITQQEYHAQRRGQLNLDIANMELLGDGITPMQYADRIALLGGGRLLGCDTSAALAATGAVDRVFGVRLCRAPDGVWYVKAEGQANSGSAEC